LTSFLNKKRFPVNRSVNLVTSSAFRKLACAFGIMAALGPARSAAQPASGGARQTTQVEMWHGLRRIEHDKANPQDAKQSSPQAQHPLEQEKKVLGVDNAGPPGWGSIGQGLPFIQCPALGITGAKELPVPKTTSWLEEPPNPLILPTDMREAPARSESKQEAVDCKDTPNKARETKTQRPGDSSETQESVTPVAPASAGHTPRSEHVSASADEDVLGKIVVQVTFILAVAIVAPLVSVVCFFWLLRRHGQHFGPLFRIDYVGAPPVVSGPFSASALGLAGQDTLTPSFDRGGRFEDLGVAADAMSGNPAPPQEEVAETFELGPTFEEERLLKENQAQQQDSAVVQQLFEDNLRLQEQIEQKRESSENSLGEDGD
jgi:hypothetical protein